ncbi:MAG: phosphodiester glycosidase family protein [Clostridia bacterium]|nr:phosphodiester glycosidase family protein [Clostridia bacterium]
MKMPVRILLILLCAVLIIALPFTVSSPNMLNDVKMELMNDEDDGEEIDFGRLFLSTACAEDAEEVYEEEDLDSGEETRKASQYVLPIDFSPAPAPDPALFTEDGYEDETISVKMEHREMDDGTQIYIARVTIADASQFRTGVANPEKVAANTTKSVSTMAKKYNAVIALNGDNYVDKPSKTTFEYRMKQKIRSKSNRMKDILIIDDQGDFHLYIKSAGIENAPKELKEAGRSLVNAFTFGPALVKDGELLEIDKEYGYNPGGKEPRAAIGQTGPLSYVMVIIQVKHRNDGSGFSQYKLAELMYELGCVQAFNLDGGNSAEMVIGDRIIKGMPGGDERSLSDIIYFATAKP